MRISDILARNGRVFSFEFFPPKTDKGEENLFQTLDELKKFKPSFVSVTYGAGGSTRDKTIGIVERIKREFGIEAMAHLTCVGASRDQISDVLNELKDNGVENVLALRGDPPQGQDHFEPPPDGFRYANQLVTHIRSGWPFCIGVAGYPEGHVECPDKRKDLMHLKRKVDAGASFIITQLFFDNRVYFSFVKEVRGLGIQLPIIPGIMPVTDFHQIQKFTKMCGAHLPDEMVRALEPIKDDKDAVTAYGVDYATRQCRELLDGGAPGVHFYTLNKSPATRAIFTNLTR